MKVQHPDVILYLLFESIRGDWSDGIEERGKAIIDILPYTTFKEKEDLEKRMKRHKDGSVKSTKFRRPLTRVYFEDFNTLSESKKKEWEIKYTPWGGKLKTALVSKTRGSSPGRPAGSAPDNLGSNPSQRVLKTN